MIVECLEEYVGGVGEEERMAADVKKSHKGSGRKNNAKSH
jgi:hypothetical protein